MEDFENSLKLSKITLLLSGINIYHTKWNTYAAYVFYFNFLWLYVDVLGELYWLIEGIQTGKSFRELTLIAPCTTICLLATAKSMPLFLNRHLLFNTVKKLRYIHPVFCHDDSSIVSDNYVAKKATNFTKNDFQNINKKVNSLKEAENKIVKNSMKFLNIVIHFLFYSCTVVVILFSILPLMSMGYHYYMTREIELKLPFLIKYFFDPFTMKTWPFVYIHQVWSTFIAGFNVFGTDTFHYAFCSYVQMHFQLLCLNFENMDLESSRNPKDVLIPLVKRHQELIKLVSDMEVLYSKSNLFNVITSSVLICLSAFNVTVLDDHTEVCAFLSFLVMSITQISLLCMFGDMLMSSSIKISEAIYKCGWYQTDNSTKRSLLLVILRAQKPCKLTAANFADLNLTAFTTMLSRSWSLFALLQTMYHK